MSKYNRPLDKASNSIPNDMTILNKDTDLSAPIALLKASIHSHEVFMEKNKENIPPIMLKHMDELGSDMAMIYAVLANALKLKLRVEVTLQ